MSPTCTGHAGAAKPPTDERNVQQAYKLTTLSTAGAATPARGTSQEAAGRKHGDVVGAGEGKSVASLECPDGLMAQVKAALAPGDYTRFKKAVKALKGSEDERKLAFDGVHAVLGRPDTRHLLRPFAKLLSIKLQAQLQTHLAGKGFELTL